MRVSGLALRTRQGLDWCIGRGVISGRGKGVEVGQGRASAGQVRGLASLQEESRHQARG